MLDVASIHKTFCQKIRTALYWNPTFHQARLDLIAAGAKYSSDPAIVAVNMASFANHDSNDWNIQDTIGTNIDVAAQRWRRLHDSSPRPGAVGLQTRTELRKRMLLQRFHLRFDSTTLRTLREMYESDTRLRGLPQGAGLDFTIAD